MLVVSDSAHGCRALAIIFTEWHHQQFEQMCVGKWRVVDGHNNTSPFLSEDGSLFCRHSQ
jgi:hypothetical protein